MPAWPEAGRKHTMTTGGTRLGSPQALASEPMRGSPQGRTLSSGTHQLTDGWMLLSRDMGKGHLPKTSPETVGEKTRWRTHEPEPSQSQPGKAACPDLAAARWQQSPIPSPPDQRQKSWLHVRPHRPCWVASGSPHIADSQPFLDLISSGKRQRSLPF